MCTNTIMTIETKQVIDSKGLLRIGYQSKKSLSQGCLSLTVWLVVVSVGERPFVSWTGRTDRHHSILEENGLRGPILVFVYLITPTVQARMSPLRKPTVAAAPAYAYPTSPPERQPCCPEEPGARPCDMQTGGH